MEAEGPDQGLLGLTLMCADQQTRSLSGPFQPLQLSTFKPPLWNLCLVPGRTTTLLVVIPSVSMKTFERIILKHIKDETTVVALTLDNDETCWTFPSAPQTDGQREPPVSSNNVSSSSTAQVREG